MKRMLHVLLTVLPSEMAGMPLCAFKKMHKLVFKFRQSIIVLPGRPVQEQ